MSTPSDITYIIVLYIYLHERVAAKIGRRDGQLTIVIRISVYCLTRDNL